MLRSNLLALCLFSSLLLSAQTKFKKTTSEIADVVTENGRTFFLLADGTVYGTGVNEHGQLGDGTRVNKYEFIFVMDNVQKISTGSYHTMVLRKDGSLWASGNNDAGQLATNNKTSTVKFIKIMDDVADVSAGYMQTLIVKKNGQLLAAGRNVDRQLGSGNAVDYEFNVIPTLENVKSVSAGTRHSFAILQDGSLWACGSLEYGKIGLPKVSRVYNLAKWTKIMDDVNFAVAGYYHSLIIKKDSTCWGAGLGNEGQLGTEVGSTQETGSSWTSNYAWVKLMDDVKTAGLGNDHSLLLTYSGDLYASGKLTATGEGNIYGTRKEFKKVLENVRLMSTTYNYSVVVQNNRTIRMAGETTDGQLPTKDDVVYTYFVTFDRTK